MDPFELELKRLIVKALILEDVKAEDIDSEAPLFGDGLGLDSIDALEIGLAVDRAYGVEIKADDKENRERFRSIRTLATFIKSELDRRAADQR